MIDDGSTDNTCALLEPFRQRIRYIAQPNAGRSAARNRGISSATSDYVAFLDADDLWYPTLLARHLSELHNNPGAHWAYSQARLTDEVGTVIQSDFWSERYGSGMPGARGVFETLLAPGLGVHTSTVLVEREVLSRVGGFDEALVTGEDTDLWIRLAHDYPVVYVPEILATFKIDTNETYRERHKAYESAYYSVQVARNNIERFNLDPGTSLVAREALRGNLLNAAFMEFDAGNEGSAMTYWREGITFLDDGKLISDVGFRLANFAISSARYHPNGPTYAKSLLAELLPKIPVRSRLRKTLCRVAYAEFFAAIAFTYHTQGKRHLASFYAKAALRSGPHQWSNVGLWKQALPLLSGKTGGA